MTEIDQLSQVVSTVFGVTTEALLDPKQNEQGIAQARTAFIGYAHGEFREDLSQLTELLSLTSTGYAGFFYRRHLDYMQSTDITSTDYQAMYRAVCKQMITEKA